MDVNILTVSSKGQIVLPVEMRKSLSIDTGTKLAVYMSGDVIMLKPLTIPTADEFEATLSESGDWLSLINRGDNSSMTHD